MTDQGIRVVSPLVALTEQQWDAFVTAAGFSRNGQLGLVALGNRTVRLFAPESGLTDAADIEIGAVAIHASPAIADGNMLIGTDDGRVIEIDAAGGLKELMAAEQDWVQALAVHQESGRIAVAIGKHLTVLDGSGVVQAQFVDHPSTLTGVAFAPNGNRVAVAHYDGVSLHSLDDGSTEKLFWHGSHTALSWSPDGRFIVTAMQDKELHGWRMSDGKSFKMGGYPAKIRNLDWTDGSEYVIAGGADTVTSWICFDGNPSGKPPLEFGYVFDGIVTAVAAQPGRKQAAGGYNDGTVLIGDIEKGDALIARPSGGGAVSALAWTPDGEGLVMGTEKGDVAWIKMKPAMV